MTSSVVPSPSSPSSVEVSSEVAFINLIVKVEIAVGFAGDLRDEDVLRTIILDMFADIGGIVINIAERGDARARCIQDLRAENEFFLPVRNRERMCFTIFGNETRRDGLVREVGVIEKAAFFHVFRSDRRETLVVARVDELIDAFDGHVLPKGSKN